MGKEFEVIDKLSARYAKYEEMIEYLNDIIKDSSFNIVFRRRNGKEKYIATMVTHANRINKRDRNVLVCYQDENVIKILIRSSYTVDEKTFDFTNVKDMKEEILSVKSKINEDIYIENKTLKQAILDEYDRLSKLDCKAQSTQNNNDKKQSKPNIDFVEKNDENIEKLLEGKILEKYIKQKERNANARKEKFKEARNKHGKVFCEVCGEDEECVLDVHHEEIQVKDMEENHVTELDDLNILCANCHRRVHGRKITVEELKDSMEK